MDSKVLLIIGNAGTQRTKRLEISDKSDEACFIIADYKKITTPKGVCEASSGSYILAEVTDLFDALEDTKEGECHKIFPQILNT